MKKDRLRDDRDRIHHLDDLIDARSPAISHIATNRDSLENDFEIPEDTDVEEALTFPHPHHKKPETIELMDTPHEADLEEDWNDQHLLPSDYSHGYSEATTADVRDDSDEIAEDQVHMIDHLSLDQMSDEPPIEVMSNMFSPEEEA